MRRMFYGLTCGNIRRNTLRYCALRNPNLDP
jgi:hypothetical protein